MKKKAFVFLFLFLAFVSAGCSSKETLRNNEKRETSGNQVIFYNPYVSYTPKGACLIIDDTAYIWDVENGEKVALCTKPNCLHNVHILNSEEPCDAYLGRNPGFLFIDDNNEFFISAKDPDKSDIFDKELYIADLDGKNRRQLAELDNVQNIVCGAYEDNLLAIGYIASVEKTDDSNIKELDKRRAGIFIINISTGEKERITEIEEYDATCYNLYISNGKIYYMFNYLKEKVEYSGHENEEYFEKIKNAQIQKICCYDMESQKESVIWQDVTDRVSCSGDYLIIEKGESSIFIKEGKETARYSKDNLADYETAYITKYVYKDVLYMADGQRVWLMDMNTCGKKEVADGKLDGLGITKIDAITGGYIYYTVQNAETKSSEKYAMRLDDFLEGRKETAKRYDNIW